MSPIRKTVKAESYRDGGYEGSTGTPTVMTDSQVYSQQVVLVHEAHFGVAVQHGEDGVPLALRQGGQVRREVLSLAGGKGGGEA